VDGVAAAIAADEVEESVGVAELLGGGGGPVVGLGFVEEVDGLGVDAVVGEAKVLRNLVGDLLVAVGEGQGGPGVCESLGDDWSKAAAGAGDCDDPSVKFRHHGDAIRPRITLLIFRHSFVALRASSVGHGNVRSCSCQGDFTRDDRATSERRQPSNG
jgi:hypothetical protein